MLCDFDDALRGLSMDMGRTRTPRRRARRAISRRREEKRRRETNKISSHLKEILLVKVPVVG